MPDLPSHPETAPAGRTDAASGPPIGGWSWRLKALVVIGIVAVLGLVAWLHLTGVIGGEGH
jgi:hypothetical protein